MYSFTDFKYLLGPMADGMADEDIALIRTMEYELADAIFDKWLCERNTPDVIIPNARNLTLNATL